MKYNLSEVMKRAWEVVKKAGTSFAAALKFSWACAKKAVVLKSEGMFKNPNGTVTFTIWAKYGRVRAYYSCSWYSKYQNSLRCNFVEMQTQRREKMTAKYKIYTENGETKYEYELKDFKSGGFMKKLKEQLVYDMRNGIEAEIDGVALTPKVAIKNAQDVYDYFFKKNNNEIVHLTDYLCGIITAKRGQCDGGEYSSVIINGKECRFRNDCLKGGLPLSNEQIEKIDQICQKYNS